MTVTADPDAPATRRRERRRPVVEVRAGLRCDDQGSAPIDDQVAAETPVVLVYNGISHAVMMTSPGDLADFAIGFSLTEGIVQSAAEIDGIETLDVALGLELRLTVPDDRARHLAERRRSIAGRTGCGLCGILSLEQAMRVLPRPRCTIAVEAQALQSAVASLPALQTANRASGAVHAAAFARADGAVLLVREDIGRHNALDKLVGALALAGIDPGSGFAVLTSRFSAELVQKAAIAGIGIVAAVSAPTTLAIELAEAAGLTLIAFARAGRFTIYTHPGRVTGMAS
jgi:FdhD protein